jgi:hypothetical protein
VPSEFQSAELFDFLEDFDGGVNQTRSPLKLDRSTMAGAVNVTVRDDFAHHRPIYVKRPLVFDSPVSENAFKTGLFQGRSFYIPDNGPPGLVVAISGSLYDCVIVGNTITVTKVSTAATEQEATTDQHWLWQAEKWIIWNDGESNPVFFNVNPQNFNGILDPGGKLCVRSNWAQGAVTATTTAVGTITIPAVNSTVAGVTFTSFVGLNVGDVVTIKGYGLFSVQNAPGVTVDLLNVSAGPVGAQIPVGTAVSWVHQTGFQLPPGRMGVYGLGRNWMSLIDGKQFVAGDIRGGASGTSAENYRDAVLSITENLYLVGGGTFSVPGALGSITAMRFIANLDTSLGQGPLQVLTPTTVFSCNAPLDRLTWQTMTNPILTESLITNGGKGQDSTQVSNGDLMFRSIDGLRSLILGRRDFNVWGNSPISEEVENVLKVDDPGLLRFASSFVFDNRYLLTTHPIQSDHGVYWKGIVPLNFDPVSTLRGKLPSIYDAGVWNGLNVLSLVLGTFNDVERGFAFVWNELTTAIELWEILPENKANIADNDGVSDIPVNWNVDSASLKFGQDNPSKRQLLRLKDGEIQVEDLVGTVCFDVYYKPDQYPKWVPWFSWCECQDTSVPNSKPGFRPRMGLGEPDAKVYDVSNNRPLREAYTFQIRIVLRGHCTLVGARFKAVTIPQPAFAPQITKPLCPP